MKDGMQDNLIKEDFVKILADFITLTAIRLPDDVLFALRNAAEFETIGQAEELYATILKNVELAGELKRPMCQDTGVLQFFIEAGSAFPHTGILKEVLTEATALATLKAPLRPNVVEPLSEHNTGTNVGTGAPCISWEVVEGSDCRIRSYMAGGGCSLPGRSKVLMPLEGVQGIKDFVYETVLDRGINACPPLIVGIGLGTCAVTSAELSKKALLRPLNQPAADEKIRALEEEIREDLDRMGIAPLGFGGSRSVLGVRIEAAAHHPATLGVGVSTGCWATRRGEIVFHEDLTYEALSHADYTGRLTEVSA